MREATGNIWTMNGDAICVTTNGFVKNNGEAVMGRGIARQASKKLPELPRHLADKIIEHGNCVHVFWQYLQSYDGESGEAVAQDIVTFPVKRSWWEDADIRLIKRSCDELMIWADLAGYWKNILLPRPGCGNGNLSWEAVKPIIEPLLDDRVIVVSYPNS